MDYLSKKLSISFFWHMHQPVYEIDGVFLMPWVRLHAVKDYIDMVSILEKYPKLKLNFNIVPALLDEIIQYGEGNFDDIHSSLTITPIEALKESDKEYILNNFFNAKYETMIYKYPVYRDLFKKRFSISSINISDFSNQEFSDLMALFNLIWIDKTHVKKYPKLKELFEKGKNYTLEDRIEIIRIQKQIIRDLIPTYQKYLNEGRIEITTSPYYHPIAPILCDYETAVKNVKSSENLPVNMDLTEDAHTLVKMALDRIEEIFGVRPKGMWPSELCVTDKVLELFANEGVQWSISDESILSKSINFEFIRDFKGNLEDPYYLLKTYTMLTNSNQNIDIIFRDAHIGNLINFEYSNLDQKAAANDLYNKIKLVQNKLSVSPDDNHLLTIALDGENCWENYQNDGIDFLEGIYSLLEKDETIETVLITDYINNDTNKKTINNLYPGSWINKDFNFWIGDPVKNLAWKCLHNVRNDIFNIIKENPNHPNKNRALRELYITEGSDWFWWYGEPNNSGQDNLFDFLFREHLKNAYKLLNYEYPSHLDNLFSKAAYSSSDVGNMQYTNKNLKWLYSNNIDLIDGPVFQKDKIFNNITYGYDTENIYFKLELNPNYKEKDIEKPAIHQFYIYMKCPNKDHSLSSIRVVNKTETVFPILKEKYHYELAITLLNNIIYPSFLSKAISDDLWTVVDTLGFEDVQRGEIEISIPFKDIGININDQLDFIFIISNAGIRNTFMPKDTPFSITRIQ